MPKTLMHIYICRRKCIHGFTFHTSHFEDASYNGILTNFLLNEKIKNLERTILLQWLKFNHQIETCSKKNLRTKKWNFIICVIEHSLIIAENIGCLKFSGFYFFKKAINF